MSWLDDRCYYCVRCNWLRIVEVGKGREALDPEDVHCHKHQGPRSRPLKEVEIRTQRELNSRSAPASPPPAIGQGSLL